jgi:hypothetical protein
MFWKQPIREGVEAAKAEVAVFCYNL